MSSDLQISIVEVRNNSTGLYDHNILNVKLEQCKGTYDPGRWICNNSLLNDEESSCRIRNLGAYWKTKKLILIVSSNGGKLANFRVREIIQEYGKEKSLLSKSECKRLQKRYNELIPNSPENNHDEINHIEIQLKHLENKDLQKAKIEVRNIKKKSMMRNLNYS